MPHAIITGAAGFIGVHLAEELLASGFSVSGLCRKGSGSNGRLPADVKAYYDLEDLPEADIFYHLAWESASGPGRADALIQSRNAAFTAEALMLAKKRGCKRFIAMGTIYERLAGQISQSGKFSGPDFYILSKDYARRLANQLAYKLDIGFAWCTVCHPIGRYIKPEQLMASVVSDLLNGVSPALGPALINYDMIDVRDAALALRLLGQAERLTGREYYIGSGRAKPLREWFIEAREALGTEAALAFDKRPDDGLRFDKSWFDISALETDTGFMPRVSFSTAVNELADWLNKKIGSGLYDNH